VSAMVERISRYRKILQEDPVSKVYVPLADLLRQHGETEEALVLLEDGLVRDPEHQSAMVVLGCTLLQAGRHDHGVKVLQRVLELSPENCVVLRHLAEHFLATDAFTHAIPMLERLVGFEPDQPEWPKLLGDTRQRLVLKDEKPSASADSQASSSSEKGLATMTLVDIMVSQGYVDKALVALDRMLEADPSRVDVQERLAQLRSGDLNSGVGTPKNPEQDSKSRLQRRAGQKEQFGDWIENFKSDRDSTHE